MRLSLFILFIAAFASQVALIFAYWVVGMRPSPQQDSAALTLTGICVALMVALAIMSQNMRTRWLSVGLIGVIALAFSALTIVSLGLLTGPIALALIVLSIVMLIRNRHSPSANG